LLGSPASRGNLVDHPARQGLEPYRDGDTIRLRNSPFHQLAQRPTELVCSMNLAMLRAATEATHARFEAQLDPAPDRCVAFASTA
ncbi:MAG TPA: hypothetical protein VGA36_01435, partial [Nitriliruptorales bacterium]